MNGIVLKTDSKWFGKPIYDAQVGTYGMCLVEMDPESGFYVGQAVQFAVLGNVPGTTDGMTSWQDGIVTNLGENQVFVFAGTGTS